LNSEGDNDLYNNYLSLLDDLNFETIHEIVNRLLDKKGLYIDYDFNSLNPMYRSPFCINVMARATNSRVGILEGGITRADSNYKFKNKIHFSNIVLLDKNFRNKNIFPLVFRWFGTHPEFIEKYSGIEIYTQTTGSAARSWDRGRFFTPYVLSLDNRSKIIRGTFPSFFSSIDINTAYTVNLVFAYSS
jgi:hypothetical protein